MKIKLHYYFRNTLSRNGKSRRKTSIEQIQTKRIHVPRLSEPFYWDLQTHFDSITADRMLADENSSRCFFLPDSTSLPADICHHLHTPPTDSGAVTSIHPTLVMRRRPCQFLMTSTRRPEFTSCSKLPTDHWRYKAEQRMDQRVRLHKSVALMLWMMVCWLFLSRGNIIQMMRLMEVLGFFLQATLETLLNSIYHHR